jgi:uncharacterized protein HemX
MLLYTTKAMAEISVEEAQENAARSQYLIYLAMGLGLAVILFISIYTSFKKKKNEPTNNEPKPISHRPFKHKHDHQHGRRGTQMRRR